MRLPNIKVTHSILSSVSEYPYYILVYENRFAAGAGVKQIYFDKVPTGSFSFSYPTTVYDYNGNLLNLPAKQIFFYSAMKEIVLDNGDKTLAIDFCKSDIFFYRLNETSGLYENSNTHEMFGKISTDKGASIKGLSTNYLGCIQAFPFNYYYCPFKGYTNLSLYDYLYPAVLSSPSLEVITTTSPSFIVANAPRYGSISEYIEAVPDVIVMDGKHNLNDALNLYGNTTFLNPVGVMARAGAVPTVAPTEIPTGDESVAPSNPSVDVGGITISLTNILLKIAELFDWLKLNLSPLAFATAVASALGLTALFQTISTPINNLFNWMKTNLSPVAFATAVASALGLSILFQTITNPLSDILSKVNFVQTIAGTLDNIANWNIEDWIGELANPLSHLLSIDDVVSDILNWDIDVQLDSMKSILDKVITSTDSIGTALTSWTFADWTYAMGEALKNVLSAPLSAIQSKTDAIAKALEGVSSWDLSKAIDTLKDAVVGALSGTLTIAGIGALTEILTNILASVKTLEISGGDGDKEEQDNNSDTDLMSFFKLIYLLLAIIILLIIIFINCLHFIVSVFSIPASTALLNQDVLKGIDFIKSLKLERFNLSLYDLILLLVHFLLFLTIIKSLRRKIDLFHL